MSRFTRQMSFEASKACSCSEALNESEIRVKIRPEIRSSCCGTPHNTSHQIDSSPERYTIPLFSDIYKGSHAGAIIRRYCCCKQLSSADGVHRVAPAASVHRMHWGLTRQPPYPHALKLWKIVQSEQIPYRSTPRPQGMSCATGAGRVGPTLLLP